MRFSLRHSRFGAAGDKLLEVCSDLLNERLQSARCGTGGEEPTTNLALDLVDRRGAVNLPWRIGIQMRLGGDVGGQGIEVVEDGLAPLATSKSPTYGHPNSPRQDRRNCKCSRLRRVGFLTRRW